MEFVLYLRMLLFGVIPLLVSCGVLIAICMGIWGLILKKWISIPLIILVIIFGMYGIGGMIGYLTTRFFI